MAIRNVSIHAAFLVSSILAWPAMAADVTPERLLNPDREPQNWLMNHRTYDGQRFSPLTRITRDNVKNLKLAYAVPLGGSTGNEWLEATPLVEDGFLYITDVWGVLYKIDVRAAVGLRSFLLGLHAPDDAAEVAGAGVDLVEDVPGIRDVEEAVFGKRRRIGELVAGTAAERHRIGKLQVLDIVAVDAR